MMDDMDELYRRAAEEYTLNTNSENWEAVSGKLKEAGSRYDHKEKRKSYRFLWLLLLLPLGIVIGNYFMIIQPGQIDNTRAKANSAEQRTPAISQPTSTHNAQPITNIEKTASATDDLTLPTSPAKNLYNENNKTKSDQGLIAINKAAADKQPAGKKYQWPTGTEKKPYNTGSIQKINLAIDKPVSSVKTNDQPLKYNQNNANIDQEISGKTSPVNTLPGTKAPPFNVAQPYVSITEQHDKGNNRAAAASANDTTGQTIAADQPPSKTHIRDVNRQTESKDTSGKKPVKKPAESKWSYSLVAAPDISIVKNRASSLGYGIGVMAGYKLNRKIAFQAGILWDKKNYYSEGKNLDTSRLKLPSHSNVAFLRGECSMIEIPVQIQYNYMKTKNAEWFFSAGLSSYIMKNETYDISYKRYNQSYQKGYSYANSTKNWFSILALNAGYRRMIGHTSAVEIAPYYKIPLKGIGIGKLPISSMGVYLIFTRFTP